MSKTHQLILTMAAFAALIVFFVPWVQWDEASVSAKDMATGHFFTIIQQQYGISNPLPGMEFANAIFWLAPALAIVVLLFIWVRKQSPAGYAALAGALLLALTTLFALFTGEVQVFNPKVVMPNALTSAWYIALLSAIVLISFSWANKTILKAVFVLLPVAVTWGLFSQIKKKEMNQATDKTVELKTEYSMTANTLIAEFVTADSIANKKYINKILAIEGSIAELNHTDSTASISFADSTGSYAIFDFEKDQVAAVKKLAVGNAVVIKALCSGGVYSNLLSSHTISFKHAIIQP